MYRIEYFINYIEYICSTNLRLKIIATMQKTENLLLVVFRDYYAGQDDDMKRRILQIVTEAIGCSYPNFYYKLKNDSYSLSDKKVINQAFEINGINFKFNV